MSESHIRLEGDYLAMAEVHDQTLAGKSSHPESRLYVVSLVRGRSPRTKKLEIFQKSLQGLKKVTSTALAADYAAYDVCNLSGDPVNSSNLPKGTANRVVPPQQSILFIGRDGIYTPNQTRPLISIETLFAHAREDALPKVRICFDLFKGEPPALVIPELRGVSIYRQSHPGTFSRYVHIPTRADARFQWQILRGPNALSTQRVAVRFEFPDITAPDFNGDGLSDLCFTNSEAVTCLLQHPTRGFLGQPEVKQHMIDLLTDEEKKDTSLRIEARLVDLSANKRPDLVIAKTNWNIADIGTSLYIYHQNPAGNFSPHPAQILSRKGYFGFQEYRDIDGDGRLDLVAPVAPTTWTDLAKIYLSKSADVDFIWYKNLGGKFDENPKSLLTINFPLDFRNMSAFLGVLPLWNVNFGAKARGALFFPGAEALELRALSDDQGYSGDPLWSLQIPAGSDTITVDLNNDGRDEVVMAYPKDRTRSGIITYIDTP